MAQATNIETPNGTGFSVRTGINEAIEAIATDNSGPTEPSYKVADMTWLDTSVSPFVLRRRNSTNTAWTVPAVAADTITEVTPGNGVSVDGVLLKDGNIRLTNGALLGDFSSTPFTSRAYFQTTVTNGNTAIPLIPNGTSTTSAILLSNTPDQVNLAAARFATEGGIIKLPPVSSGTPVSPITSLQIGASATKYITIDILGALTAPSTISSFPTSGDSLVRAYAAAGTGASISLVAAQGDAGNSGVALTKANGDWNGWLALAIKNPDGTTSAEYFGSWLAPVSVSGSTSSTLTVTSGSTLGIASAGQIDVNTNYGTSSAGAKQSITSGGASAAARWRTNCQYELIWSGSAAYVKLSDIGNLPGRYFLVTSKGNVGVDAPALGVTSNTYMSTNISGRFGTVPSDSPPNCLHVWDSGTLSTGTITAIYRLT